MACRHPDRSVDLGGTSSPVGMSIGGIPSGNPFPVMKAILHAKKRKSYPNKSYKKLGFRLIFIFPRSAACRKLFSRKHLT
jgi:hypothetical protein